MGTNSASSLRSFTGFHIYMEDKGLYLYVVSVGMLVGSRALLSFLNSSRSISLVVSCLSISVTIYYLLYFDYHYFVVVTTIL